MKKKIILQQALLILTFFLVTGCMEHEEDILLNNCPGSCTVIRGTFTTAAGTVVLPNLPLEVEWINQIGLLGGTVRRKATAKTDINGKYELRFLIRDDELQNGFFKVEANVNKNDYLVFSNFTHGFSFSELTRDTIIIKNYVVPRKAFVEISISNPGEIVLANNDSFGTGFYSNWGEENQVGSIGGGPWITWSSHKPNEKSIIEVAADQPLILHSIKIKNGSKQVTSDTIQLHSKQLFSYQVTF